MSNATILATVTDALALWVELTGVDLNARRWTLRDWDIRSMNEELQETLRLDPTGASTYLLLECFLREYLEHKHFTAAQIIKDYAALTAFLAKAQRLFSLVQSDDACELAAAFRARVTQGLHGYDAATPETLEHVNNPDILPFLRRDALRSLDTLRPYQFLAGERDSRPPRLINRVYVAWDVNKLLPAIRDMPHPGVALILLRDPAHRDRSYFCFGMRNGDNVIILTDKTQLAHPAQADMTRRTDRQFSTRAWQNHFPYQMLKSSIEDDRLQFDPENDLVSGDGDLTPLMPISALEPHQIIWITMMLSLIAERFWNQAWSAPELSYTAAMIETKDKLVHDRAGRHLPIARAYQPITLDRLNVEDVTAKAMAAQIQTPPTGANTWLEERYKHVVTADVLNHWLDESGTHFQLPPAGKGTGVIPAGNPSFLTRNETPYLLKGLAKTEFGTEAELRADQLWLARYNQAMQIQKAADEEYLETKEQVFGAYRAAVTRNLPALLEAIAEGDMPGLLLGDGFSNEKDRIGNILTVGPLNDDTLWSGAAFHHGVRLGAWRPEGPKPRRCAITGAAASYRARFSPQTAESLAQLCGGAISDLPVVLQHWRLTSPYSGNGILNRLDPVDTKIKNPWQKLCLNVNVYLSKRTFDRIKNGQIPSCPIDNLQHASYASSE